MNTNSLVEKHTGKFHIPTSDELESILRYWQYLKLLQKFDIQYIKVQVNIDKQIIIYNQYYKAG